MKTWFFILFFSLGFSTNAIAIVKNEDLLNEYFFACLQNQDFNIGGQFEFCGCGANQLYQNLDDEDFVKIQTGTPQEKEAIISTIKKSIDYCKVRVSGS